MWHWFSFFSFKTEMLNVHFLWSTLKPQFQAASGSVSYVLKWDCSVCFLSCLLNNLLDCGSWSTHRVDPLNPLDFLLPETWCGCIVKHSTLSFSRLLKSNLIFLNLFCSQPILGLLDLIEVPQWLLKLQCKAKQFLRQKSTISPSFEVISVLKPQKWSQRRNCTDKGS